MSNMLPVVDMSNTFIEHSFVINNFVIVIGRQIQDSLCRVLGDGVQYQWAENNNEIVIPDVSIICNTRDRKNVSLTGIPRMVMELSPRRQKHMTEMRKWIFTGKSAFPNTGSLTGARKRWKYI